MAKKRKLEEQPNAKGQQQPGNAKRQKQGRVEKSKGKGKAARPQVLARSHQPAKASPRAPFLDAQPQMPPERFTPYHPVTSFIQTQPPGHEQDPNQTSPTHLHEASHGPQGNAMTNPPLIGNPHSRPRELPPLPPIADQSIAHLPFTHSGSLNNPLATHGDSYEQLEFVGDAYIELMATRLIYQRYKHLPVGRMSQLRELLVKNETLAEYSRAYGFDARAAAAPALDAGGSAKARVKVLGDMFEAYVAAVVLSDPTHGFATAEAWLAALWRPKLDARGGEDAELAALAKQELAKRLLGRGVRLDYVCAATTAGQPGEGKVWYAMDVHLTGWGWSHQLLGSGQGLSKGNGGTRAAMQALLNPLTEQIAAVKREFDARTAMQNLGMARGLEGSAEAMGDGEVRMAM